MRSERGVYTRANGTKGNVVEVRKCNQRSLHTFRVYAIANDLMKLASEAPAASTLKFWQLVSKQMQN